MERDEATEAAILAALDRADHAAAATLALRVYGPQILGYLTSVLRSESAADDAFADFSEDLWTGLPGFARRSSVRVWAYKIAWHAALKVAEDPYKKRGRAFASHEYSEIAAQVRTDTAVHLRTETRGRFAELRGELTRDEQSLLVLRIDRKLSWREVSEAMDADEAALRKRLERVKDKLKALARARGLVDR